MIGGLNLTINLCMYIPDLTNGGCYEDKPARMLTGKFLSLNTNTPSACKDKCQDFKYFAVQYTNQCFCGDTLHHLVKKPESECAMKCPGDSSQTCGGSWRQNVYETAQFTVSAHGKNVSDTA